MSSHVANGEKLRGRDDRTPALRQLARRDRVGEVAIMSDKEIDASIHRGLDELAIVWVAARVRQTANRHDRRGLTDQLDEIDDKGSGKIEPSLSKLVG